MYTRLDGRKARGTRNKQCIKRTTSRNSSLIHSFLSSLLRAINAKTVHFVQATYIYIYAHTPFLLPVVRIPGTATTCYSSKIIGD